AVLHRCVLPGHLSSVGTRSVSTTTAGAREQDLFRTPHQQLDLADGSLHVPIVDDISGLRRILTRSRTIAVVASSQHCYRPSYFAAKYMRDFGYRIIPVNPAYTEVLGERCYPDLRSAREGAGIPIDIVDCFRKPPDIPPIARDAVAIGAKVLWMQLG